ncbi:hypothetical protein ACFL54_07825 [Planctomycetota bacterium]
MDPSLLFGKIAVKNQMLTEILVDEGLTIQREFEASGVKKTVGEIFLEKGYLSKNEVDAIVAMQSKYLSRCRDVLFGKIAVKNGLVTKEQVVSCLEIQNNSRKHDRIGEIMVDQGYLSYPDYCAILKAQTRLQALAEA